jgi:hypothetical protein
MFTVRQVITVAAAAFMCAVPVSIDRSPEKGISLSLDSAQAVARRTTRRTVPDAAAVAPRAGEAVVYCKTIIGEPVLGSCVVGDPAEPYGIGDYGPLRPEPAGVPCCAGEFYPQPPSRQLWDRPWE